MKKKIGIGVAAIFIVLLLVIVTRPNTYRVERSTTIAAPPEAVYAQVSDFRKWAAWSPWGKLDPNMKTTFEGTQGAVGAGYAWTGNDDVGAGRMTITGIDPNKRVDIKLEFIKPFESSAANGFAFEPSGTGTKVTWSMNGDSNFLTKAFSLFVNMDEAVGKDFEKGLGDMKKVVESAPLAPAPATVPASAAVPAPDSVPGSAPGAGSGSVPGSAPGSAP